MQYRFDHIRVTRTAARILSLLLFLLWCAFFIEHLSWFSTESLNTPPVRIWLAQGAHLLLLVGYLVSLKWERVGSVLIAVNAVLFFGYAAGMNAVPFIIVSLFPVMLYAYCWHRQMHRSGVLS